MHVSLHRGVRDPALVSRLWVVYERGYGKVAESSVTHEMFDRQEFEECLRDESNRCWLAWDDGVPVGLAVVATDVRASPWLSTQYFERHDPERMDGRRIHYLMFVVIDKPYAGGSTVMRMARELLRLEASENSLLIFDVPEINQPQEKGGLAELMRRLAKMIGESEVHQIHVQRYYSVEFAPVADVGDEPSAVPATQPATLPASQDDAASASVGADSDR
jgi:hypothetical protein